MIELLFEFGTKLDTHTIVEGLLLETHCFLIDQQNIFACIVIGQCLSRPYQKKPKVGGCLWHITSVVKRILE